jgi:hypothetical protein
MGLQCLWSPRDRRAGASMFKLSPRGLSSNRFVAILFVNLEIEFKTGLTAELHHNVGTRGDVRPWRWRLFSSHAAPHGF